MKARRLVVTPRARRDFKRIVEWYRETLGASAASKLTRSLQAGLRAVTTIHPDSARRADLPIGFYRVVVKTHMIVFQIEGDISKVVRILYGARDVPAALGEN